MSKKDEQQRAETGISAYCLSIMIWGLDECRKKNKEGAANVKRNLIAALNVCRKLKMPPPRALISAIKVVFGVYRQPRNQPRRLAEKRKAVEFLARHPRASNRAVARAVGLPADSWGHTVVGRWKKEPHFQRAIETCRSLRD